MKHTAWSVVYSTKTPLPPRLVVLLQSYILQILDQFAIEILRRANGFSAL